MALSGSIRTNESEGRSVTLNWTATQSVENNRSTISWSLVGSGSAGGWVIVSELRATINGSQVYYRDSSNHTECWIGTTLASGTTTIDHNADGSKIFSMSVEAGIYQWAINCSGSGSFTLNSIPRASQPSCITYPQTTDNVGDMGSSIYIHMNRVSSSFTHTVRYAWGNKTGTIASGVENNTQWTIPLTFADDVPNSTSGYGTIYVDTYNGSTFIGTKSVRFTSTVPASIVPSITSITLSDPNGYASTYGGYIQNKSQVKVQVAASGSYSSTITNVSITANGSTSTSNPYTSNVITASGGSKTVYVTVTDSRGRRKTQSASCIVLSYTSPTISTLTARRCDADGTANDSGAYMKINYEGSITSLNNNNSKNLLVKYKPQDSSTWTNAVNVNEYSINNSVIVAADINKSYDISFVATDSFGSTEKTWKVSTAFTLMDFNSSGKGMAIGKVSEQNALELALDVIFTKKIQGLYPVGSIYISVNNTNPSTYFGGTWEQIKDRFLLAAGNTYSGGSTGGEATHTLTVNEMPSHDGHMYDNMNDGGWVDRGGDTNSYFLNSTGAVGFGTYENRPWKVVSGNEMVMQGYSKGGSQAHNNMPPYLTVYVWKRTS